jgi:hypothetical protein
MNAIKKVRIRLEYSQTMNYTQVILCEENKKMLVKAKEHLEKAIMYLHDIQ